VVLEQRHHIPGAPEPPSRVPRVEGGEGAVAEKGGGGEKPNGWGSRGLGLECLFTLPSRNWRYFGCSRGHSQRTWSVGWVRYICSMQGSWLDIPSPERIGSGAGERLAPLDGGLGGLGALPVRDLPRGLLAQHHEVPVPAPCPGRTRSERETPASCTIPPQVHSEKGALVVFCLAATAAVAARSACLAGFHHPYQLWAGRGQGAGRKKPSRRRGQGGRYSTMSSPVTSQPRAGSLGTEGAVCTMAPHLSLLH
jgi:hypothetical protein